MSKSGRKLVMLCRKANKAEGKGTARNFFCHPLGDFSHPLKISLPPHGRNPESAPAMINDDSENREYKFSRKNRKVDR